MDEFKETSINKFEQAFGAFDKDWTDNSLAQYVKNYIRDVNGNPTTLEMTINNALNKSELWKKYFIPHYGDRAALSLTNSITSRLGYLTLGFFNVSSALLNFSQLINAAGYLGEAGNLGKYFAKYMKGLKSGDGTLSMRDLSILTKVGTLNEIGLDSSSGYDQSRGHTSNIAALNLLDRFGNWSMGIFQKTDALCRIATTLAAYDQAKAQGKSDAEAIKYAREINRKSNFDYSVADAPNIFRRGSVIAQLALQFRKYGIKELEVMADMLSSVTNKKQKAIFWGLYFLAVGLMGVPAGDWLDWLAKDFLGLGSPKNAVQESIMEVCGKSPEGKALGRALMYGIAGSVGVNISSRVGMQDVIPTRSSDLFGVAASKTYNLISDLFNEGFGMQAIRDVSPGAYNLLAAGFGESRGNRGRLNSTYDDFFERALRAIGFKSTGETIPADVQRIIYDKRDKLSDDKQKAIDTYIEHPTTENARKLRKLGVKPKTVQEERKRKRMERLGRMDSLLSKKERRENRDLLNFAR